jgi:streptomycin 6-kinase
VVAWTSPRRRSTPLVVVSSLDLERGWSRGGNGFPEPSLSSQSAGSWSSATPLVAATPRWWSGADVPTVAPVLKLTPDSELGGAEAWALRKWESSGRVPLVWGYDATLGALLLEAIPSESPVSERRAAVELGEVADLIGGLHRSRAPGVADGVVSLAARVEFLFEHWVERHGRAGDVVTRAVPVDRLRRGHGLARGLAADAGVPVLLHGDLHPGNVLDGGAGRGLVAIDPRPCVGDAAFDVVDWVFWAVDDSGAWEPRSRDLALALGLDHERLWAWCAAFAAMLAAAKAARGASAEQVAALLALAP